MNALVPDCKSEPNRKNGAEQDARHGTQPAGVSLHGTDEGHGAPMYRLTFTSANRRRKKTMLHFRAADEEAVVYINGKLGERTLEAGVCCTRIDRRRRFETTTRTSRYRQPPGTEAEAQPGSRGRVLVNRLGLDSQRALDLAQVRALEQAQTLYYERLTPNTGFTAFLLKQMHQDWLGQIFDWAGEYRQVELVKDGFRWPPAERVPENMRNFEEQHLRKLTPCRPVQLDEVATAIAVVHSELLLIHPFRDGNGRLARWLADLMAIQAGYPAPDYGFSGRGSRQRRVAYIEAVQHGYVESYESLTAFFASAILRRRGGT